MKTYLAAVAGLSISTASLAQNAVSEVKSFRADPVNHPSFPVFATSLFGVVVFTLIIVVLFYLFKVRRLFKATLSKTKGEKKTLTIHTGKKRTIFQSGKWQLYSSVGLLILITTVAISWKMMAGSQSQPITPVATAEIVSQPDQPALDKSPSDVKGEASSPIEKGKQIYQNNCVACHGNDGGGNTIGPNLTDEFWLHGGEPKSINSTIQSGVANTSMPAWANILNRDDIKDVTSYVLSLQGTNPPDAKGPQGEKFIGTAAE